MAGTVVEILTYEGDNLNIILNYIALTLTILTAVAVFHSTQLKSKKWRKTLWIPVLIGLSIFQVILEAFYS